MVSLRPGVRLAPTWHGSIKLRIAHPTCGWSVGLAGPVSPQRGRAGPKRCPPSERAGGAGRNIAFTVGVLVGVIAVNVNARAYVTNATEESILVDRAISGDPEAFARLYDIHMDRVYRHLYFRMAKVEEAEDLTQQVFLQAWQSIRRFKRTNSPFIAWLMTIAHNLIVDRHRSKKAPGGFPIPLEMDVEDHDRGIDPEWYAQARLDQAMVRQALKKLKPEQQYVIAMRFLENFDYSDIAAAMGKTEGNVRVIQHRGLQALRKILEGE